jgi:serine protease Do
MKIAKISGIGIVLAAFMFYSNACTMKSSRETPVVQVIRQYAPMVVNVRTENMIDLRDHPYWGQYGEQLDLFFKKYFAENYSEGTFKYKSVGSGVIVGKDGLIVTNAHVVQKASDIFVVLNDGTILQASVIRVNHVDDLAILKTELPHLVEEVKFADIQEVMIGETVIAIGNPLGLENSVTVGVVSGKDRAFSSTICEYMCSGLVQTDASINPGNSGGALLNLDGELVGVNVAVVQDAQNIGFAIPVDKVVKMLETLK